MAQTVAKQPANFEKLIEPKPIKLYIPGVSINTNGAITSKWVCWNNEYYERLQNVSDSDKQKWDIRLIDTFLNRIWRRRSDCLPELVSWQVDEIIGKRFTTIRIDEFRISKSCSKCWGLVDKARDRIGSKVAIGGRPIWRCRELLSDGEVISQ